MWTLPSKTDNRVRIKEKEKKTSSSTLPENWKVMKHEGGCETNCSCCVRNNPQGLRKWAGMVENQKISRDHSNNSIVKIGQNTQKSPGDLRRFVVSQNPIKDHLLTLVWKIRKEREREREREGERERGGVIHITKSHGKQHGGCDVRQMKLKLSQRWASLDAGRKNFTDQETTDTHRKDLPLLMRVKLPNYTYFFVTCLWVLVPKKYLLTSVTGAKILNNP